MDFIGKRTDRMRFPTQVSQDPEMGSEIRARASRRRRSVGSQIVHLLTIGLLHDPEEASNERVFASTHIQSHSLTEEKVAAHFPAQPHTADHSKSQKRRTA